MKHALVTGGGGFLGLEIVKLLLARGVEVRSYSRSRHTSLDSLGVLQIQGDLNGREIDSALAGCDTVFHVAAKAGFWGKAADYDAVNYQGTLNVIRASKLAGVRRLVYTSTPSVAYSIESVEGGDENLTYQDHYLAPYPASKAKAERFVRGANDVHFATVSLRPHLIWGPGDPHLIPRLVAKAKAGKLKRVGDATNKVDVTFVENAALAHVQAAERLEPGAPHAGQAYFISDGEPVLLWEFINRILAIHEAPPVTKSVSFRKAYMAGRICEVVYKLLPYFGEMLGSIGEPPMTRFVACNLALSHWFDISAAKRDFGYKPQVTTEEGLRRLS